MSQNGRSCRILVSSHAPVRGHHTVGQPGGVATLVSSHAPVRGHPHELSAQLFRHPVSSHAPVRGHPAQSLNLYRVIGFKSCPREGASCTGSMNSSGSEVSSHAPVRGHPENNRIRRANIRFKSCPREGASPACSLWRCPVDGFKSCPREGASAQTRFCLPTAQRFQVMPP